MPGKQKNAAITTSVKIVMFDVEINGKKLPGVNYRRTEYSDGRVVEAGLPADCKPGTEIGELIALAFRSVEKKP